MVSVRSLLVASLAIGASFAYPSTADACRCGGPGDVCWELKKSVVFRATALGVAPLRFQVHEVFSGAPGDVVEVADGPGNCAFGRFQAGKEYLVYAWSHDGRLFTNMCTRTALLAERPEELLVHRPSTGRIFDPRSRAGALPPGFRA